MAARLTSSAMSAGIPEHAERMVVALQHILDSPGLGDSCPDGLSDLLIAIQSDPVIRSRLNGLHNAALPPGDARVPVFPRRLAKRTRELAEEEQTVSSSEPPPGLLSRSSSTSNSCLSLPERPEKRVCIDYGPVSPALLDASTAGIQHIIQQFVSHSAAFQLPLGLVFNGSDLQEDAAVNMPVFQYVRRAQELLRQVTSIPDWESPALQARRQAAADQISDTLVGLELELARRVEGVSQNAPNTQQPPSARTSLRLIVPSRRPPSSRATTIVATPPVDAERASSSSLTPTPPPNARPGQPGWEQRNDDVGQHPEDEDEGIEINDDELDELEGEEDDDEQDDDEQDDDYDPDADPHDPDYVLPAPGKDCPRGGKKGAKKRAPRNALRRAGDGVGEALDDMAVDHDLATGSQAVAHTGSGAAGRRTSANTTDAAGTRLSLAPKTLSSQTRTVLFNLCGIISPTVYGQLLHALQTSWLEHEAAGSGAVNDLWTISPGSDDDFDGLRAQATKCATSTASVWVAIFQSMLAELRFCLITFRLLAQDVELKLDDLVARAAKDASVPESDVKAWIAAGKRWGYLMLSGSLPLLLAVAVLEQKTNVYRLDSIALYELAACIRDPSLFKDSRAASHYIIPALLDIGACFNVRLGDRIFGANLAEDASLLGEIDYSSDWRLSELPANSAWLDWCSDRQLTLFAPRPLDLRAPLLRPWTAPAALSPETVVLPIPTLARSNLPFDHRRKDARDKFTHRQQKYARYSTNVATDVTDLKRRAALHVEDAQEYLVVPNLANELGRDVVYRAADQSFIGAELCTSSLPAAQVDALFEVLQGMLHLDPDDVPKASSMERYQFFHAFHFTFGNRYSEKGPAKDDTEPVAQSVDTALKLKGNYKQRIPRLHLDARRDMDAYFNVMESLRNIFALVAHRIKELLGEDYELLNSYVDNLPAGSFMPCYPFAGIVLNFGVMTKAHRDKDLRICVVITFGNFTGGELGLYEVKLLLRLQGFSIFVFPSDQLTHFNMPFEGQRGSLVLTTEGEALDWVSNRNRWKDYLYGKKREGARTKGAGKP